MSLRRILSRPFLRWFPADFRADPAVANMTPDQRRRYRDAIDSSWLSETPGIASEEQWMTWLDYDARAWPEHRRAYLAAFTRDSTVTPEKWTQKRLLEEYLLATNRSHHARVAAGGRWGRLHAPSISEHAPSSGEHARAMQITDSRLEAIPSGPSDPRGVGFDSAKAKARPRARVSGKAEPDDVREWRETFHGWFWPAYWRKTAKAAAEKAWMQITPKSQDTVDAISAGLERHARVMLSRDPEKRPHASTWLNQRRWEDNEP